jgi:hypothetical protein
MVKPPKESFMPKKITLTRTQDLIDMLREEKPGDRSELDRRYAVVLTELEKVQVLINHYLVEPAKKQTNR